MRKDKMSDEKRKFNRFTVTIPVECEAVCAEGKDAGRSLVHTTTKNISSNGILLNWPGEYRLPQFLRLGIKILLTSKPIESVARTVWTKQRKGRAKGKTEPPEQYDMGLSFIQDEQNKLPRLISRQTDFYWEIFERTGHIQAYLLHKGVRKEKEYEDVPRDG